MAWRLLIADVMRLAPIAAILCCLACAEPQPLVHGRVTDAVTDAPIAGARVSVADGAFAITDDHGRFVLAATAPFELRVDARGYLAMRRLAAVDNEAIGLWPEILPDDVSDSAHAKLHSERPPPEGDVRPGLEEPPSEVMEFAVPSPQPQDPRFGQLRQALFTAPQTIRVWRRRLDGSTSSCTGRVDVIPFNEYIKGVLPHEWIASWDKRSLRMGAVAIRSYAWAIVTSGGRYQCADVDDTSNTQVYRDDRLAKTDAIVDETQGQVIVRNGKLVAGQYSAENGDPTAFGVSEPQAGKLAG